SVKDQGLPATLRQEVLQRLGALTLPLPAGEHCTERVNVEATAGKTTKLSLKGSDPLGARDSDSLQVKGVAAAQGRTRRAGSGSAILEMAGARPGARGSRSRRTPTRRAGRRTGASGA